MVKKTKVVVSGILISIIIVIAFLVGRAEQPRKVISVVEYGQRLLEYVLRAELRNYDPVADKFWVPDMYEMICKFDLPDDMFSCDYWVSVEQYKPSKDIAYIRSMHPTPMYIYILPRSDRDTFYIITNQNGGGYYELRRYEAADIEQVVEDNRKGGESSKHAYVSICRFWWQKVPPEEKEEPGYDIQLNLD